MIYYEAPNPMPWIRRPAIFLAGGITGCPQWQMSLIEKLKDQPATIFNPRRKEFDVSKIEESRKQIEWEFVALWMADIVPFWFPKEALCPIALYELGAHLVRSKMARAPAVLPKICIGIEPGYQRELDIRFQKDFIAPETPIFVTLDEMAQWIDEQVKLYNEEPGPAPKDKAIPPA